MARGGHASLTLHRMKRLCLFLITCALAGIGGTFGSVVGHGFGRAGLIAGGLLGGLLAVAFAVRASTRLGWLAPSEFRGALIGGAIGFVASSALALSTASNPIGPILATSLAGLGAVAGAALGSRRAA
ncbi:MAG: hypothetical protein JWO05_2901 [Gemmatimonadetes bacterium]|nr:hypothetical protein [Gemmatimonadota bacterium]